MKNKKSEVILIRSRGGKLEEVRIFPISRPQGKTRMATDGIVVGAMETKRLPEKFSPLLEWLDQNGKLSEVEEMIKCIFQ